jgi:hypothetical protein
MLNTKRKCNLKPNAQVTGKPGGALLVSQPGSGACYSDHKAKPAKKTVVKAGAAGLAEGFGGAASLSELVERYKHI